MAKAFHLLSTFPVILSTESSSLNHKKSTKRSKYVGTIDIIAKLSDFEHAANDFYWDWRLFYLFSRFNQSDQKSPWSKKCDFFDEAYLLLVAIRRKYRVEPQEGRCEQDCTDLVISFLDWFSWICFLRSSFLMPRNSLVFSKVSARICLQMFPCFEVKLRTPKSNKL